MSRREAYVVDTYGLPRGDEISICRMALGLVADVGNTFEADIPWSKAADWPADVEDAARRLSAHSKGKRGENELYRQTGVLSAADEDDWLAFVTFAPYAFDASVWSSDHDHLVGLSDEGTLLSVRLTPTQRRALQASAGEAVVVPHTGWRKRRRRLMRTRRREGQ